MFAECAVAAPWRASCLGTARARQRHPTTSLIQDSRTRLLSAPTDSPISDNVLDTIMLTLASNTCLGYSPTGQMLAVHSVTPRSQLAGATMLEGTPRPVQIIPSVLPADWANSARTTNTCETQRRRCG